MSNIKLESNDGKVFEIKKKIAKVSLTIKNMLDDLNDEEDGTIPLSNVSSDVLEKVIEYCNYYHENSDFITEDSQYRTEEDLSEWEKKFCDVDQEILFKIILAANYLDIKPLLDLTCLAVAFIIEKNTVEDIRKKFNIINDFTPEEEEKIMKENEWCRDL